VQRDDIGRNQSGCGARKDAGERRTGLLRNEEAAAVFAPQVCPVIGGAATGKKSVPFAGTWPAVETAESRGGWFVRRHRKEMEFAWRFKRHGSGG
jgi:hypothetical protein